MAERDKILVVDDLEINRRVLDSYLSSDYDVIVASGGEEALDLIQKHEVEIALLDVNMPNMTGFELSDHIRKMPVYSELPIIFVTGAALDQTQVIKGLSIGSVDYLCKPFDLKILFLKVQNFIDLSKKTKFLKKEIVTRKESEEKLRQSTEREKQLIEQLKLSEKMEAVGRLASGISHDLNNLMTALSGHAELLQRKLPEENSHLHAILNICETGIDIGDKLKVFSRNRSTRKKVFNISKLITDLEEMCDVTLEANIEQEFSTCGTKLNIYGSTSDIQNALLNLIINARDSIDKNGLITVSCSKETLSPEFCSKMAAFKVLPGEYVCISVKDNGRGMDEETLKKIFEPFFSTKDEKGTGLGMSSVFQTMAEHTGCIEIKSALHEGTEVKLYFQLEENGAFQTQQKSTPILNLSGVSAFVVDDDENVLECMSTLLKDSGANIESHKVPESALESFKNKNGQVDLVIADHIMPHTNGSSLVQEMRELNPQLKFLIATGLCDQNKVQALREEGAKVLTKPFQINDFIEAVQDCLQG